MKDVGAQRKIFAEQEMTYEKALSIAQGQEMAASNVATLQEKTKCISSGCEWSNEWSQA